LVDAPQRKKRNKTRLHTADESPDCFPAHYTTHAEPATTEDLAHRSAKAQPNQRTTAQERRDQYVDRFIYPWAYSICLRAKTARQARNFDDKVDLLTARVECNPYIEDELERLRNEDEIELPEDPREHYRAALSEWGRARHLRKIARLTGTYPRETGDMDVGEIYSWYLELYDAVAKWQESAAKARRPNGNRDLLH
jgi:hypothetical protein